MRSTEPRPVGAELDSTEPDSAEPDSAEPHSAEPGRQLTLAPRRVVIAPSLLPLRPSVAAVDSSLAPVGPPVLVLERKLPPLKLESPAPPVPRSETLGNALGSVPTASWAMGCAAGVALAVHALYQNTSDRRRQRMQNCAEDCPDYRIDHYKETRERADIALRLSVFAAASAVWLAYNDPQEALERMGQRKLPREKRGFRVKVKPERRGVWASVVAYF